MTTGTTVLSGACGRRAGAGRRLAARVLVLVVGGSMASACGLQPEKRIDDPDCEYCYRLASGVKYKTYPYYAP